MDHTVEEGERSFALMLELSDEEIERMGYLTIGEAADMLRVSRSRVHQLFSTGQLDGKITESGERLVSTDSVNARRLDPPPIGRPRKALKA